MNSRFATETKERTKRVRDQMAEQGVKEKPYTQDDFRRETKAHVAQVAGMLERVATELRKRAEHHDDSKLREPELSGYTAAIPQLKKYPRGSSGQKKVWAQFKPVLDHHYANNRHHPQHFKGGVKEMNLVDAAEMICDWCSAAMQREGAKDLEKVVRDNQAQLGLSDDLIAVLANTARDFGGS